MHLITLFRIMNPHQRCLQAKVKYRNEPKQVMPKSDYLSRSLEINAIWTFDTEFPTIFNKSCTSPQTCQHWSGAGPMLYTQSARCWQNILARHWPGIVCTAARYWPNAGITLYAVMTPLCVRYT